MNRALRARRELNVNPLDPTTWYSTHVIGELRPGFIDRWINLDMPVEKLAEALGVTPGMLWKWIQCRHPDRWPITRSQLLGNPRPVVKHRKGHQGTARWRDIDEQRPGWPQRIKSNKRVKRLVISRDTKSNCLVVWCPTCQMGFPRAGTRAVRRCYKLHSLHTPTWQKPGHKPL